MSLDLTITIFKLLIFIIIYTVLGFGPGFVIGMLLANRTFGREKPQRINTHQQNIRKAGEHNKQWHPQHERWQKE